MDPLDWSRTRILGVTTLTNLNGDGWNNQVGHGRVVWELQIHLDTVGASRHGAANGLCQYHPRTGGPHSMLTGLKDMEHGSGLRWFAELGQVYDRVVRSIGVFKVVGVPVVLPRLMREEPCNNSEIESSCSRIACCSLIRLRKAMVFPGSSV